MFFLVSGFRVQGRGSFISEAVGLHHAKDSTLKNNPVSTLQGTFCNPRTIWRLLGSCWATAWTTSARPVVGGKSKGVRIVRSSGVT